MVMIENASRSPTIGESTMNTRIFWNPEPISEPHPAFATAAPASPPTRACDELVGMPNNQVTRSHRIAPINPEKTMPIVMAFWSTTSFAMVAATLVPRITATRCHRAAQATATRGVSTRVETTVAISLAAS